MDCGRILQDKEEEVSGDQDEVDEEPEICGTAVQHDSPNGANGSWQRPNNGSIIKFVTT